jgi:hypothetical protein
VVVISGSGAYSSDGVEAFKRAAISGGVTVTRSLMVGDIPSYASLTTAVTSIAQQSTRIVFLMSQASTAGLILREAYAKGVFGAESGYVWFFTDAITTGFGSVLSSLTDADPCSSCGGAAEVPAALTEAEAAEAMRGVVGMAPVSGYASSSYAEWVARYTALPDTVGADPVSGGACAASAATISGEDGATETNAPAGPNCTCSAEVDSAGRLLWQLDHDGDPSTPERCTGIAYSTGYLDLYTSYAYDGMVALAMAADAVGDGFTGPALIEELHTNVTFDGVTGPVKFTDRDDNRGDREVTTIVAPANRR